MANLTNRFGFIVFSSTGPEAADLLGLPGSGFTPGSASVILVPGERYWFYLPIEATLGNTEINLLTDQNRAVALIGIGVVNQIVVSPTLHHLQATIIIPAGTVLPEVYYRLQIQTVNGALYSNRLWLRRSGFEQSSALFSYRNRSSIGPIAYDLVAMSAFRNILRLKCETGLPQTDSEVEEYEQITTGVRVPVSLTAHLAIPVVCANTDAIGHEGWRTLCMHKDILMNGRPVSVKTGYQEGEGSTISDGSFQVWDSNYSIVNRC